MTNVETQPELEIIAEPSVFLLGRQQINEEALAEFLSGHEIKQWSTDTQVAGEKLIETAGRVCLIVFPGPRPGGQSCLHPPPARGRPRLGARACRIQLALHRREP